MVATSIRSRSRNQHTADKNRKIPARAALGIPADAFVAITLGAVHERKGQLPLIEVWLALIRTTAPTDSLLLVVGPREASSFSHRIDSVLTEAGPSGDTVMLTGQTNDSTRYLRAADVYVSASHAEGLPVACRWLEGVTDDFMNGQAVTPISPQSVEGFVAAMDALRDDRARLAASRDARDVAEQRFDVRRMAGLSHGTQHTLLLIAQVHRCGSMWLDFETLRLPGRQTSKSSSCTTWSDTRRSKTNAECTAGVTMIADEPRSGAGIGIGFIC